YKRNPQDVLRVEDYCEPIIDELTWKQTRASLEKNKHPNYGEHIHLFAGLVKCPVCGETLCASESFKHNKDKVKIYFHLRCLNPNCSAKGYHYNSEKIETKLKRVLNVLTRFMYDNSNEIITCNSNRSKEINDLDKAIEKLKMQEKRLVDLYLSSTLDVETINHKNEIIKKEIEKLNKKKSSLDPNEEQREYTIELLKKLDCEQENDDIIFKNNIEFSYLFDSLNRKK
ncbi:MAG: hypothetical protein ACI4XR_02110, partial [Bacilli bacterium]